MAKAAKTEPDDVRRVKIQIEARLDNRPVAIDLVSTLIQHVDGATRDFRHEMITAFGEAFNNIVIHGYRNRTDGMLDVEAELRPEQMTLNLYDTGHEVDFGGVDPPDLASMPESGMGVFMIHALVDEVRYRSGKPNMLSLMKRTTPEDT
jgi:serine/threonine-protein kinase RsbW